MADNSDEDCMDAFMDKFKTEKYDNAFNEENWEEEFERIPMFMSEAPPDEFDSEKYPELATLQAILHDEDRTPQAEDLKNEGNSYFKEKNYEKAIVSYSAALSVKSGDGDFNAVIYSNRAAAQFYLGNMRSALKDAMAAKKLKPDHLKALIRGAQCCIELRYFAEGIKWCDMALKLHPTDKKLLELRAAADKHKRAADRDARKAKAKEKNYVARRKLCSDKGIKLLQSTQPQRGSDTDEKEEDEGSSRGLSELRLDGLSSQEVTGAQVFINQEDGAIYWPVLFLYPEHQQSDFISAFCENHCFSDHLAVMFGEELPPWDAEQKYRPPNLQVCPLKGIYISVLRNTVILTVSFPFFVKAGTPSFIVLVKDSPFCKQYLSTSKVQRLKV
uniref:Tetratricopeptide repeat domain 4 n=1 Tax=Neogobius melanostomus TaxID=47308 RepID=A0A8C6U9L1_9GOBI